MKPKVPAVASRGRNLTNEGGVVLELEQDMLESQAHKAKVIVSKAGKLLSYDEYKEIMDQGRI